MTIQSLKHNAFRIWAATVFAIPLCLWLLSRWNENAGLAVPLTVLSLLFALGYAASGWLGTRLAQRMIPPILHEAGIWERSGDMDRAQQACQKALSLYDSFLMAPSARRAGLPRLVARMARMYAAQTERHEAADAFLEHFLEMNPGDAEIAQTWLLGRAYHGGLTPRQQDLAARIGDAHVDNMTIQMGLARLYLLAEQTDFPALQTYRRVMSAVPGQFGAIVLDLSRVFIGEGRSDEWALPVYLLAARQAPQWEALGCGLAACLRWILPSERNAEWLDQARQVIGDVDDETLVRMSSGFVPPTGGYRVEEAPGAEADVIGRTLPGVTLSRLRQSAGRITDLMGKLPAAVVGGLRRSPGLRRGITWGLMAGLGIIATVFLINTVGYLTPSPPPEPEPVTPPVAVPAPPPMPYTLQVAAYLKPEHAQRYLDELRKHAIGAYVVKAHSNEKTWYQVRIAHFPDKAQALAYGGTLKAKGLIEDFYVAMDQAP